jgi:protein translocase SecG subunit
MLTNIIIAFLSVVLFLDSIILILLVLIQVPKKEAGAGMAFGGAATDALFGAGSGTALTAITRYSAGIFFGSALIISIIGSHRINAGTNAYEEAVANSGSSSGPNAPLAAPGVSNPVVPVMPAFPSPALSSNSAAPATAPATAPVAVPPPAAGPAVAPAVAPATPAPASSPAATNK